MSKNLFKTTFNTSNMSAHARMAFESGINESKKFKTSQEFLDLIASIAKGLGNNSVILNDKDLSIMVRTILKNSKIGGKYSVRVSGCYWGGPTISWTNGHLEETLRNTLGVLGSEVGNQSDMISDYHDDSASYTHNGVKICWPHVVYSRELDLQELLPYMKSEMAGWVEKNSFRGRGGFIVYDQEEKCSWSVSRQAYEEFKNMIVRILGFEPIGE